MNRGTLMSNSEARKKDGAEPEVYTREQMAEAWDEGWHAGWDADYVLDYDPNPYRTEAGQ